MRDDIGDLDQGKVDYAAWGMGLMMQQVEVLQAQGVLNGVPLI
jgi:hypothetical protein